MCSEILGWSGMDLAITEILREVSQNFILSYFTETPHLAFLKLNFSSVKWVLKQ